MLRAYEAYLIKKGTVKPQSVPYYLKWISDCYSSLNEPLSNRLGVEQKRQFLSEMAKRHEDWQVKQADTALRLYDYFLSKNVQPAIAEAPPIFPLQTGGNPWRKRCTRPGGPCSRRF
jgi:hypothetical protein